MIEKKDLDKYLELVKSGVITHDEFRDKLGLDGSINVGRASESYDVRQLSEDLGYQFEKSMFNAASVTSPPPPPMKVYGVPPFEAVDSKLLYKHCDGGSGKRPESSIMVFKGQEIQETTKCIRCRHPAKDHLGFNTVCAYTAACNCKVFELESVPLIVQQIDSYLEQFEVKSK